MVKYKNISNCHVMAIVDGKLIVIDPGGIASGRSVVSHPGLALVHDKIILKARPKKIDKKRKLDNASETTDQILRE